MMHARGISRKNFIKNSTLGLAGLSMLSGGRSAIAAERPGLFESDSPLAKGTYSLKNVRLETGFDYRDNEVIATQTALFTLEIKEGKISAIKENTPNDHSAIDAQGLLMLPSFKDMHIHLDKTYYSEKWQAVRRGKGGVKGMIALEQQIMPELLKHSREKAEKLIELLQSKGTGFARSHVNIEPTSKLRSLEHLQEALQRKQNGFSAELVAFPQHGVFYTDSADYLKQAAQAGVDFIGGLDPSSIDGDMKRTMDFTIDLALSYQKGIDIHLHETGASGVETIEYLIAQVLENPSLKGKTFVSHAFCLAKMEQAPLARLIEGLSQAEIGIISTVPFGSLVMPIPALMKAGVSISTGNDSIVDHWNTFGSGSVLEKANLAAQLYGYSNEYGLSRMLKLATAGPTPLSDSGAQQWPKVGDQADFVLVEASCSAEAVSRVSPIRSLVHKGHRVY